MNYFDKALYELTLSEAAYLAALPKGPANYHPFRHPEAAIERRNHVINRMLEEGYVTAQDAQIAKNASLDVLPRVGGSSAPRLNISTKRSGGVC